MTSFHDLGLAEPLVQALDTEGYQQPTPIQAGAIPHLLNGKDVLGIAQTGTGKTAAFALPLLHHLHTIKQGARPRSCRVLVLTPTRELAVQVADSFATYGREMRFKRAVIFGGVGQNPQVYAMARGVDVLVATPGRLLDLMNQGHVRLDGVERFVLDEADRMLAMGFIQDVRKIVSRLPEKRQTVMFSATMPEQIASLASSILHNPQRIEVTPESTTAERINQSVLFVNRGDKRAVIEHLFEANGIERALIFTRTKHGANRLAEQLDKEGFAAAAIHGNKSQGARQQALNAFRDGRLRALVATDIAARGIDVEGLTHVINFELPNEPESYVHRIGRTARAGADGTAISLCEIEEVAYLRDIEKSIRQSVPVVGDHPWHCHQTFDLHQSKRPAPRPKRGGATGGRGNGSGFRSRDGEEAGRGENRFQGEGRGEGRPARGNGGGFRGRPGAGRSEEGYRPEGRFQGENRGEGRGEGRGDRPFGDRPRGPRPQGDRPQGDRPRHERSAGQDRPFGDRPRRDRAAAGEHGAQHDQRNHRSDSPRGDRPDHRSSERPQGNRQSNGGERTAANANRKPHGAGKDSAGKGGGWGRPQRRIGRGNAA